MEPGELKHSLPERLMSSTRELHGRAERSHFMSALLRGEMDTASYRDLLLNLQAIYVALESELDRHRDDPAVAWIRLDGIARAPSLARDLAAMPESAAGLGVGLQPSTRAYVDRLHAIGSHDPFLLVAHAYVRYLGDLSGGQILRRIVGDKLDAPTAFYEFGSDAEQRDLRAAFRRGLEQMTPADEQIDAIVAEAVTAFERHVTLFEELRTGEEIRGH